MHIRSAVGQMKKIINKFSGFALVFLCCFAFATDSFCAQKIEIKDNIALYGQPKYGSNFTHFEYARKDAPKGGKIVLPGYGNFDNFNPFILKGNPASPAVDITLDSLAVVPADDYSTAYPLIAQKFEIPEDKSFIGFILNKNAKFSDGSPVLADDVIFSFNALIEKGSPIYKVYYGDVEKTEKINDRHVRFYFKKNSENNELPLIISQIKIMSKKDFENKDFSKPATTPLLGSGPYVITDFKLGKYVVLKRNPDYWAKNLPTQKGFYNFDTVRFDYYQDTTVTLQALFSGNIDLREEYIAKIWVTGYNNDLVKSGKVIQEKMFHKNPAILQNFSFNLRRQKFQNINVRKAVDLAFNFDWANEKLFYNQYSRLHSYFTNSEMESSGLPPEKELRILEQYKDKIRPEAFEEYKNPSNKSVEETRENLRQAVKLLKEAGYDFVDGKMTNLATGEPLEIEVLSNSSNGAIFNRVMLPFIENLRKIGIKMTFRILEINIFKNRLDSFDFDIAIISYPVSKMPGNEQREYWGSRSANTKGSFNYIGIKNEVVDELIEKIISAQKKDDYIAHIKALDRVLLSEHYLMFQWYSQFNRVAYQNRLCHPENKLHLGFQLYTWWDKTAENSTECKQ